MASRERGRNIVAAGRTCRSPLGSAGEEGALTWFSYVEIGIPRWSQIRMAVPQLLIRMTWREQFSTNSKVSKDNYKRKTNYL